MFGNPPVLGGGLIVLVSGVPSDTAFYSLFPIKTILVLVSAPLLLLHGLNFRLQLIASWLPVWQRLTTEFVEPC